MIMEDEMKSNTLIEKLNKDVAIAHKQHKDALQIRVEGTKIVNELPDFITSIDWYVFRKQYKNEWYLETFIVGEETGDELVKLLKLWGVFRMKPHYKAFNNTWCFECSAMIGDIELTIKIDGGSKPPNCTIEETKEMKEVITYKAICPETGEEL